MSYRWRNHNLPEEFEGDDHNHQTEETVAKRFAAILWKGTNDGVLNPTLNENFDFWHLTTDMALMLKTDDNLMIMAESHEALVAKLEARYPTLPGCTLIQERYGPLHIYVPHKAGEDSWDYRRRCRGSYDEYRKYRGWVVLNTPHRLEVVDREHLRSLLVETKALLLNPRQVEDLGGEERLLENSFSPVGGGHGLTKVRWNPKLVALRKWRAEVKKVEALHVNQFPEHVLSGISSCFNPDYWRGEIPFTECMTPCTATVPTILTYIKLAQRLKPGSRPWRDSTNSSFTAAIEAAAPTLRHLIKNGDGTLIRKLARWILREAHFFKIKIPHPCYPARAIQKETSEAA